MYISQWLRDSLISLAVSEYLNSLQREWRKCDNGLTDWCVKNDLLDVNVACLLCAEQNVRCSHDLTGVCRMTCWLSVVKTVFCNFKCKQKSFGYQLVGVWHSELTICVSNIINNCRNESVF